LYDVNGANPNSPLINQSFTTFVNINDELGNLLYREEHFASTDANGLITVKMGDGLYTAGPITNFNQINWGVGKYYLVVDFDINGTISSTAPEQLVTVPYSFYAGKAGNGMTSVADNGNGTLTFTYANGATYTTPTLAGIQGAVGPVGAQGPIGLTGATGPTGAQGIQGIAGPSGASGSAGAQGIQGVAGTNGTDGRSAYEIALLNGFVGTETQWLLSLVGETGPQGTQGPAGVGIPQTLSQTGNTITLSDGGGSVTLNDPDADPTNELQALSIANDTLYLSNGNSVYLGNVIGSGVNPPGFPNGFNNMLPIFGAEGGCMAWGSENREDYIDGIMQTNGGMIILAQQAEGYVLYRTNSVGEIVRKIKFSHGASTGTLTSFCKHPTNGNLYFTGSYNNYLRLSITDSTGSAVIGHYGWSNLGEGKKIIYGSDNNLYILGSSSPPFGNGGTDVVVTKVNLLGTITNKFIYGTAGAETSNDLIQLSDGNFLVSFQNNGGYAVVTKINTSFAILWSKQLDLWGGGSVLFQSSSGDIYVAYPGSNNNTLRIVKIASDGTFVLGKNYSFNGYSSVQITPSCFIEKSSNSLVLVGSFNNTVSGRAGFTINLSNLGVVQGSSFGGSSEPYTYQSYKKVFYRDNHLYLFGETNLIGWGDRDVLGTKLSLTNSACCLGSLTVGSTNNAIITNYSGTTATFTHVTQGVTWFVSYPVLKVYSECYE
jgi:hypothetical protein